MNIRALDYKNIVLTMTLVIVHVFFSIFNILRLTHAGREDSYAFTIFCLIFLTLSLFIVFFEWFKHKVKFNVTQYLFLVFIPLFISVIFFIENAENPVALQLYQYYLSFGVVSSYIGIYYSKNKKELTKSLKYWVLLIWLLTIGSFIELYIFLFTAPPDAFQIMHGQRLSYTLAIAYSLNLLFLLCRNKIKTFSICNSKKYTYVSVVMLLSKIVCIFISGGRGGFVVIVFSTFVIFYYAVKKKFIKAKILIGIIIVFVSIFFALPVLLSNEVIRRGYERVFSYITPAGIDATQASGRDIVWRNTLYGINERLIFGHGIFGQIDYLGGTPHNFFLEVLLSGGLIYLFIILLILLFFIYKFIFVIKNDINNSLLLPFISVVFVSLMVSGTYLTAGMFWFLGAYVFSYEKIIK